MAELTRPSRNIDRQLLEVFLGTGSCGRAHVPRPRVAAGLDGQPAVAS